MFCIFENYAVIWTSTHQVTFVSYNGMTVIFIFLNNKVTLFTMNIKLMLDTGKLTFKVNEYY